MQRDRAVAGDVQADVVEALPAAAAVEVAVVLGVARLAHGSTPIHWIPQRPPALSSRSSFWDIANPPDSASSGT